MTYAECVRYLYSLGNEVLTAKLGLDRISILLRELGDPHRVGRFIHVAGTNGKGSTAAMIESGLRGAGARTGLYTSPHLLEPTERIQVDGRAVSEERFAAAFEEMHGAADRLMRAGALELHPTYFESVTTMAFLLFREAGLDYAVLEVGMGGRLDATNVVTPELCTITPVDLDHQAYLGNTLGEIAGEKAGILKAGVAAVIARQHGEAADRIRREGVGELIWAEQWPVLELEIGARGSRFRIEGIPGSITCPLAGEHQVENARVAAIALHRLGFPVDGMAGTVWPGRLERVSERPEIILDGAHNPAGTRALAAYIRRFYSDREIWLVFGALRDKPVREMAEVLFPLADRVILAPPPNSRAVAPEAMEAREATVARSVEEAVGIARTAGAGVTVFITGSLFLAGAARGLLVQ